MVDEILIPKTEVKTEKKGKTEKQDKPKRETKISKILKILQMKTVKDKKMAVAKLKEYFPNSSEKLLGNQVNYAIRDVNNGKIKNYTWNKEEYLLVEKN
jgi:hypothetical protein